MSDPDLAPALNELLRQFDALAAEVERDPSKLEAAQEHLGTITAVDAQGYIWGLNADGVFFRAVPNGQWEQADPTTFAAVPSSAPSFVTPSFASPSPAVNPMLRHQPAHSGPEVEPSRAFSPGQLPGGPTPGPHASPSGPYGDPYAANQGATKKKLHVKNPFASTKTATPREGGYRPAAKTPGIAAWAAANRRIVVIAAILIFVAAVVVVEHGKKAGPSTATTQPTTVVTLPRPTAAAPAPSAVQEHQVVAALTSGRAGVAAHAVAAPGSIARQYFYAAELYGFARSGLAVHPRGRAVNGVQTWLLTRGTQTVASASVTWTRVHGGWKVTSWPLFHPAP